MTKFGTLLKVNLRQLFRARKNTSKKTMPVWGIYIVLGVVLLPLLAMLFSTFVSAGEFLSEPQYAPYLNAAVTFAITAIELVNVFFGLKSMLGTVYMSNDSDMLLALPVKTVTIFLSKLAVCYIVEFFSTLVMLAATLLPLGIGLSAGAGYFAALIFGAFLIPLISLLAVAILSVPLLLVSNLFRNKGAVGTIIYVLLFGALMALYMWFVVSLGWGTGDFNGADVGAMLDGILESVSSAAAYLYPNVWLSGAFTAATFGGWIGNFALFLLSALVLLGLTVLLSGKIFLWNMRKSQENAGKGAKKNNVQICGRKQNPVASCSRFQKYAAYKLARILLPDAGRCYSRLRRHLLSGVKGRRRRGRNAKFTFDGFPSHADCHGTHDLRHRGKLCQPRGGKLLSDKNSARQALAVRLGKADYILNLQRRGVCAVRCF